MIGTIIGDIVGSIYEFHNIKTKDFPFFGAGVTFTDDSIMALAVAKAIMEAENSRDESVLRDALIRNMKDLARKYPYPMGGYGNRFNRWVKSDSATPYNSWGNGSAMRVAACGFAAVSLDDARNLARICSEVTHNHPEAVAGAQITAACIYMAKNGKSQEDIAEYVRQNYCPLHQPLDEIRETYVFTERCRDTVPQAIQAFLEAKDFEDAIRNAVSIGGDSDTLAAITGGIAEAFFGVPGDMQKKAKEYLPKDLLDILEAFDLANKSGK